MKTVSSPTVNTALRARLEYNELVLQHLPEVSNQLESRKYGTNKIFFCFNSKAFAILVTPSSTITPFDVLPALKHAARIADEACYLTKDKSVEVRVGILGSCQILNLIVFPSSLGTLAEHR